MNQKKAKSLRRKTYNLVIQFVIDRVLPPEEVERVANNEIQLRKAIPTTMYFRQGRTVKNGVLTHRWFYKQVKKNPEITYEQILQRAQLTQG